MKAWVVREKVEWFRRVSKVGELELAPASSSKNWGTGKAIGGVHVSERKGQIYILDGFCLPLFPAASFSGDVWAGNRDTHGRKDRKKNQVHFRLVKTVLSPSSHLESESNNRNLAIQLLVAQFGGK